MYLCMYVKVRIVRTVFMCYDVSFCIIINKETRLGLKANSEDSDVNTWIRVKRP